MDESSSSIGSGAGIFLTSPEGVELQYALKFKFSASNNTSEYEALISGARMARCLGAERVRIYTDSQLVASQINEDYEAREPQMIKYLRLVKEIAQPFVSFQVI